MNKKKKVIILISAVTVLMVLLFFIMLGNQNNWKAPLSHQNNWEAPSSDWFLEFSSIDEINYVRELLESGTKDDLIEFVQDAGNGHNVMESESDVTYFLDTLDDKFLPVNFDWLDFAYEHSLGMFFLTYSVDGADELEFIIPLEEKFDQMIEANASDYTLTDVTDEIAAYANQGNFDGISLRIGNGVQAFSFYRHATEMDSIRETEEGLTVSVSLNVEGNAVSATVSNAFSLEEAFEILANVEFARGGWSNTE